MSEQENRESYIRIIESLYPADADNADIRSKGASLILEALWTRWRDLPTGVLRAYAELCMAEDGRDTALGKKRGV